MALFLEIDGWSGGWVESEALLPFLCRVTHSRDFEVVIPGKRDRLAGETEVDLPAPLTTVVFLALAVDPPAPATVDPLIRIVGPALATAEPLLF